MYVSITIVINFAIYTYRYLVYHNTDEGRRRCQNISVVKKLKVVLYLLKILTSLLLNRPFRKRLVSATEADGQVASFVNSECEFGISQFPTRLVILTTQLLDCF